MKILTAYRESLYFELIDNATKLLGVCERADENFGHSVSRYLIEDLVPALKREIGNAPTRELGIALRALEEKILEKDKPQL